MQLLSLVLNKTEHLPKILSLFMQSGIKGTTVLDCEGSLSILGENMDDAPPIFGSLRQFLNPRQDHEKFLMVVLRDEQVPVAKRIVNEVVGGIDKPNTGIMFTIDLSSVDGLAK